MTFIDYQTFDGFCFVRLIGLEPTQLALLDPKSSASTNFATGACGTYYTVRVLNAAAKLLIFFETQNIFYHETHFIDWIV